MVNLEQAANLLAQVTPVRVEPALCVRARSPKASCQGCLESCPLEAITLGRRPEIDRDRCSSCGLCVANCPTGSLRLETPSPSQLLASARKVEQAGPLLICKSEATALGRLVQGRQVLLPCIGMLTTEVLAGLVAGGHEQISIWRSETCDSCTYGPVALRQIEKAVAGVEALYPGRVVLTGDRDGLVTAHGNEATTRGDGQLELTLAGEDRRAFLGSAFRGGGQLFKALFGEWIAPTKPERPDGKAIFDITGLPGRRQVLGAALGAHPPVAGARLPERERQVAGTCTLCPVCSRLCPAGALALQEGEGKASLTWRADRCTDCNLCAAVCPVQAIGPGEQISVEAFLAKEPQELVAGLEATCECGGSFYQVAGGPTQCLACRWAAARDGGAK